MVHNTRRMFAEITNKPIPIRVEEEISNTTTISRRDHITHKMLTKIAAPHTTFSRTISLQRLDMHYPSKFKVLYSRYTSAWPAIISSRTRAAC